MIPYGPWHPDAASINGSQLIEAVNCTPSPQGFRPLPSLDVVSNSLPSACVGAATVIKADGSGASYAGTQSGLYLLTVGGGGGSDVLLLETGDALLLESGDRLLLENLGGTALTWVDVSRTTGGPYSTGSGERWRFASFGDMILATNFSDVVQKASISGGGVFSALGGTPPQARYIGVMRDFVVLSNLVDHENRVHWSGINNAESWTVGVASSDYQDMPTGGPIQGFIGGEVGYVFQRDRVTRMTYLPGSDLIMQFDEVEGGRGLVAPNSLVRLGNEAFYLTADGFYRMNLASGGAAPIGVAKWHDWFTRDMKAGSELFVFGSLAPQLDAIVWSYVSKSSVSATVPDKMVIYNTHLDEAAVAEVGVNALSEWLTYGVTLDTMNSFGTLDTLPVSLDSPFWKGGVPLVGVINADNALAHFTGSNLEARFVTTDGQRDNRRTLVQGVRPHIDSPATMVALSARERDGDTITFEAYESMEDTGVVPGWVSGNLVRARIKVPAGSTWTYAKGLSTLATDAGSR